MSNYQFAAFTEAELLAQGTMGSNVGRGDSFVMPQTTSTVFDVVDNDPYLSGDRRDNAADRSGQIATVTENGAVTSSGEQIYAELYFWVKDQAGNWYVMIEVEIENTSGDYFTFFGNVPTGGQRVDDLLPAQCLRQLGRLHLPSGPASKPSRRLPPMTPSPSTRTRPAPSTSWTTISTRTEPRSPSPRSKAAPSASPLSSKAPKALMPWSRSTQTAHSP